MAAKPKNTQEDILHFLCSHVKLDRDRGLATLEQELKEPDGIFSDEKSLQELQNTFINLVNANGSEWEVKQGALLGTRLVILDGRCSDDFCEQARLASLNLMHNDEVRVRLASGEVLGALCQLKGSDVYTACREKLLKSVSDNLERRLPHDSDAAEWMETDRLVNKLVASQNQEQGSRTDAAQIFHDTAGWKHLETSMRCLQSVIEGCGKSFDAYISQQLLDLIFQALNHTNRFVRETGYQVCASLVRLGRAEESRSVSRAGEEEQNAILTHGQQFASYLAKGLADNWSQVRLAASVATRQFLQTLPSDLARDRFFPILAPRMCLNRYYVAEGVRIYSQDSWKMIVGQEGKHIVEKYIKETVEFYISQTEAENHAVREAACACVAELGIKVNPDCVRSHVPALLQALVSCFKDDSWPVRDAACVACGNFVKCFPDECRSSMDELYPLFFGNLADPIPSVRQGAAIALANVVKAYGEDAQSIVFPKVRERLLAVEKQENTADKYGGLETGPATFGVVKRMRDNDMELHTNKQMYSCGSLAPKMGRGGGCMDHKFKREPQPWELADGCVDLVAELSSNTKVLDEVQKFIPLIAKAAEYRHYTQHVHLLETVCKQLPVIGKGIGKRHLKGILELFIDSIFYSLSSDNALTSSAASECLAKLGQLLGPSILRGRVEMHNPRYAEQLDHCNLTTKP